MHLQLEEVSAFCICCDSCFQQDVALSLHASCKLATAARMTACPDCKQSRCDNRPSSKQGCYARKSSSLIVGFVWACLKACVRSMDLRGLLLPLWYTDTVCNSNFQQSTRLQTLELETVDLTLAPC